MGPCAKTRVRCTIVAPDGARYVGENLCEASQPICPRAPGEGYEKCATVCRQIGHAEAVASRSAGEGARGGVAYVEGHTYACDPCLAALAAVGVHDVRIGAPPSPDPLPPAQPTAHAAGAALALPHGVMATDERQPMIIDPIRKQEASNG